MRGIVSQALEVAGVALVVLALARVSLTAAMAAVGLYLLVVSVALDRGAK